jgi:hypothetical protein
LIPEKYFNRWQFDRVLPNWGFFRTWTGFAFGFQLSWFVGGAFAHWQHTHSKTDLRNFEDKFTHKRTIKNIDTKYGKIDNLYEIPITLVNRLMFEDYPLDDLKTE